MRVSSRSRGMVVATLLVVGAMFIPAGAVADPRGDNGTVKIDGIPFDQYPDNQPHVGCIFEVDFYGFDLGAYNATVTFYAQPPTAKFIQLMSDSVFIGEDAAGGGTDLDAEQEYDLSTLLEPYFEHPNQGFHVKLKVNAPGSIGKDTKFKTFWVTGCNGVPV